MRAIEFQIRKRSDNSLIGWERINNNGHWEHTRIGRKDIWLLGAITHEDDLIRTQFTGLLDRNGKKIFEGDIVQRGIITFGNGRFTGTYYDSNGDLSEDWEDELYHEKNIEVLGNIYEHRHLLNQI